MKSENVLEPICYYIDSPTERRFVITEGYKTDIIKGTLKSGEIIESYAPLSAILGGEVAMGGYWGSIPKAPEIRTDRTASSPPSVVNTRAKIPQRVASDRNDFRKASTK